MCLCYTVTPVRRIGQNRVHTPYKTLYVMISLPNIPCTHQNCQLLLSSAQVYTSVHKCRQVYTSVHKCRQVYTSVHKCTQVHTPHLPTTALKCTQVYTSVHKCRQVYKLGWPKPYIYTVYDCIFGGFPAKNTVYTPYIYGFGQPYVQVYTSARV